MTPEQVDVSIAIYVERLEDLSIRFGAGGREQLLSELIGDFGRLNILAKDATALKRIRVERLLARYEELRVLCLPQQR